MADGSRPGARIFFAETRFQKLARRPGGVPRDQAIARAETHIEALKPEFADWLDGELRELTEAVRHIDGHADDLPRLEQAHRRCCQLRDVGATMGFEITSAIAGNLCEIFDAAARNPATYRKEAVDCHIEALLLTSKPPYSRLRSHQLSAVIHGLRRIVERVTAATSD